jgi:hypothetical protein
MSEHHRLTEIIPGQRDGISLCRSHVSVTIRLRNVRHIAQSVRQLSAESGTHRSGSVAQRI